MGNAALFFCFCFFFFNSKDISTQSLCRKYTPSFIKCLPLKVVDQWPVAIYTTNDPFFFFFFPKANCTRVLKVPPICDFFFFFFEPASTALPLPASPPDHELVAWPACSGWTPSSCCCYPVRHPRIYFMEDGVGHFRKLPVEDVIGTFIHLECFVLTPG